MSSRGRTFALALAAALTLGAATGASSHPIDLTDVDHDGLKNVADNCQQNYNPNQRDTDADTPAPVLDTQQSTPQTGPIMVYPFTEGAGAPTDRAPDTGGDACDTDDDGDGVTDSPRRDNCRLVANPDQADSDFDGLGDACDPTPTSAPPSAAGADDTAPTLSLRVGPRHRYGAISRGLAVGVVCSEACAVQGSLARGGDILGRGSARIDGKGFTYLFVRVPARALRRLASRPRTRAALAVTAVDAAGNRSVLTRKLLLRR